MKNNRTEKSEELTQLLNKTLQDANSVSSAEKKSMKKLISDPKLFVEAVQKLDPDLSSSDFPIRNNARKHEEIIADNYIELARFAIEKLQLKNIHKLRVEVSDDSFIIYALTPEPVELCFEQFATSDYPYYEELLLEAEALESDLLMEDSSGQFRFEIIRHIESVNL